MYVDSGWERIGEEWQYAPLPPPLPPLLADNSRAHQIHVAETEWGS